MAADQEVKDAGAAHENVKGGADPFYHRFGLTVAEVFEVAQQFYKAERGKLVLSYEQSNKLSAFHKQVTQGTFTPEKDAELGFFDFVGHDRRKAWQALGQLSSSGAQAGFSQLLMDLTPKFEPAIVQAKRDKMRREDEERRAREAAEKRARQERERQEAEERQRHTLLKQQQDLLRQDEERRHKEYAQQQALLSKQQQDVSVRQEQLQTVAAMTNEGTQTNGVSDQVDGAVKAVNVKEGSTLSKWSRPNVKQFMADMRQDSATVFTVGRSDSLLVRVPLNKPGLAMFWEFATDDYDISFGVRFEPSQTTQAQGGEQKGGEGESLVPSDVLLPTERCNSHEEVTCGSHRQDVLGTYLLHFDNTYSYFRAKTVHLHVYQTD